MDNSRQLRFRQDGSFTIMQITDVHGIYKPTTDTIRLLEAALDRVKPDLVVFTGDQIKGYGLSYLTGDKLEKVRLAVRNIAQPVDSRNIPFAVTFGNHDPQVGIPLEQQFDIYKSYKHFVPYDNDFYFDPGTYALPIAGSQGDDTVFNLYLIDSRSSSENGGYAPVDKNQIAWYKRVRDRLKEKTGNYVPSIVFQHIPLPEMYDALKRADKKTPGAVKAFRTHKGEYYVLNEEITQSGGVFLEPPSIPDENTGEFEAFSEKGDVLGVFFGHDHQNSFIARLNNVDLGFGPSCGFNEYGNGVERGVRVYTLNEKDTGSYTSYDLTYREIIGKKVINPLRKTFYDQIPTSIEAAIPFILKCILLLGAVVTAIVLLIKFLIG